MLILGLLGMYFDAVVVEVKTFLLLFRLALAILCSEKENGITVHGIRLHDWGRLGWQQSYNL